MKYKLAYGQGQIDFECNITENITVIRGSVPMGDSAGQEIIKNSLLNPTGTKTLPEIIQDKSAQNAVIVVNDITRPTPYGQMLPPLLEELESGGIEPANITLLIATGIHRHHTDADNLAIFGEDICRRYKIINHDCDHDLVSLGSLSTGLELIINRLAAEADLLITTGVVGLHYFAGYSGGRKSILPGIAARKVIEANHKMMNDARARLGNYEDNPVSDLMQEAARRAGVDFILNVVLDADHGIAYAAAGELEQAWFEAVKYCERINTVIVGTAADIVIASCGGFPKDINMYQAQKALDAAVLAVKRGGTIILAAECREGLGEETFAEWIRTASCPQDIVDRFHKHFELGGHKAFAICRILEQADILLVSSLPASEVVSMFMTPVPSLDKGLEMAIQRHGPQARIIIMPEASGIAVKIGDPS